MTATAWNQKTPALDIMTSPRRLRVVAPRSVCVKLAAVAPHLDGYERVVSLDSDGVTVTYAGGTFTAASLKQAAAEFRDAAAAAGIRLRISPR